MTISSLSGGGVGVAVGVSVTVGVGVRVGVGVDVAVGVRVGVGVGGQLASEEPTARKSSLIVTVPSSSASMEMQAERASSPRAIRIPAISSAVTTVRSPSQSPPQV
jgi:hypothetical protein